MRLQGILALAVVALSIAACGGGGGGGGSAPAGSVVPTAQPTVAVSPATSAPLPAGYAVANVKITVPAANVASVARQSAASTTRTTQTVGTGTASITFTLLQINGAAPTNAPAPQSYTLNYGSAGCSTNTAAPLVCSLNINAPIGSDVFLATTYTSGGAQTGSGAVALSVALNSSNTASLSLDGQVSSVYLTSSSTHLGGASSGNVTSMRVFVVALDSSGNIVLNPATYSSPVVLQLVYTSGGYSDTNANAPDVQLAVAYNSSVDPGGCGGNVSTSSLYGTINVCSPTDVITATFLTTATAPAPSAVIIGSVGGSGNLPFNGSPVPVATGYTGGIGALPFSISPLIGLVATQYTYDYTYYPVTAINATGLGNTYGATGVYNNTVYIYESGFAGTFTVGGTCASFATLTLTNTSTGEATLLVAPTAPTTGCTITLGDGTNTLSIPMTVTTTTVAPVS